MILHIYDKEKNKLFGLTKMKELCIESTLSTGDKSLTFEYPRGGVNIEEEYYIRFDGQEYVVRDVEREMGEQFVKIRAVLNAEEIEGAVFANFEAVEKTPRECLSQAFAGTGWSVADCEITKRRTVRGENISGWDILQEAISAYSMEIVIDSINKTVSCYNQIGTDRGAYAMDGINIKSLDMRGTTDDFYTRIIPIGKDGLTLPEGHIDNFQYSNKVKSFIWQDDRYTDVDSLREDAIIKLETASRPYRSYAVSFINLAGVSKEYEGFLEFKLGDTITLSSKSMGIREKQRIVKMREFPMESNRNSCELSSLTISFGQVQKQFYESIRKETTHKVTAYQSMSNQFAALAAASVGAFNTEKEQEDGSKVTYYHDQRELKDSKYIRQESVNGILFSADGGKTWKGIDKDGNALLNNLFARTINADLIRSGRMESHDGKSYIDLDTGEMTATKLISTTYPQYMATIGFTPIGTGAFNVHEWGDCIFSVHTNTNSGGKNGVILTAPHLTNAQRTNEKGLQIQEDGIGLFAGDGGTGINDLGLYLNAAEKSVEAIGNFTIWGDLKVANGSKSRAVKTSEGYVDIAAYETAEPMFGDIGEAKTDDNGIAIIKIEPLFAQTVNVQDYKYQVFLQPYAKGDFWVKERAQDHFIVKGTSNCAFAWEIKAKQKGYENCRLNISNIKTV